MLAGGLTADVTGCSQCAQPQISITENTAEFKFFLLMTTKTIMLISVIKTMTSFKCNLNYLLSKLTA